MKISQTDGRITIVQKSYDSYFMALLFVAVGIALPIFAANSTADAGSKHVSDAVGLIFVVSAIVLAVLTANKRVTIQLGGDTIIKTSRLGRTSLQTFSTESVTGVRLVSSRAGSNKRDTILFVMSDGTSQVIAEKNGGSGFTILGIPLSFILTKPPLQNEAQQLANFLQVPLDQNNLMNLGGVIATAQEVMAEMHGTMAPGQLEGLVAPQLRAQFQALQDKQAKKNKT